MKTTALLRGLSLAVLVAGALSPLNSQAANTVTYKWLDEEGKVVYGDHPPKGVDAEQIRISTGTSSTEEAAQGFSDDPEAKKEDEGQLKVGGIDKDKADEYCKQARTNLEVLENNALIRQKDDQGQERILSEDEKQEQIATAREIANRFCQ